MADAMMDGGVFKERDLVAFTTSSDTERVLSLRKAEVERLHRGV